MVNRKRMACLIVSLSIVASSLVHPVYASEESTQAIATQSDASSSTTSLTDNTNIPTTGDTEASAPQEPAIPEAPVPEAPSEPEEPTAPEEPSDSNTETPDDSEVPDVPEDSENKPSEGEEKPTETPEDPSATPGETPTPEPSEIPEDPDAVPTETPEVSPTPDPSVTPTPSVSPTPTPSPTPTDEGHYPVVKPTLVQRDYMTVVDKVYAVADHKGTLLIKEGKNVNSRVVGRVREGGICFILSQDDSDWVYVESGEVRGFVEKKDIVTGDEANQIVTSAGGYYNLVIAQEIVNKENNSVYKYTNTSVYEPLVSKTREDLVNFALQFVGNPYVWGGTSLTNGADCSGFVQSLYASFGVYLPRTAAEQSCAGTPIAVEDARPGDLIFYQDSTGYVFHVVMYMGNGQIVHAANSNRGIVSGDSVNYMSTAAWACDFLGDGEGAVSVDNAVYTQDQLELIWALVGQECSTDYNGALAVISSALNRATQNYSNFGTTVLEQLTAPGQFCYDPSIGGNWKARLNGNVEDFVKQAVSDCLDKGIVNHNYLNFRSTDITGHGVNFGDNWYF